MGEKFQLTVPGVEDALDVTMAQRSELDYLIYNDPLGYADLILNGNPKEYLKNVTGSHGLEDYGQTQGAPRRTHPAKIHIRERYVQQGVPRRERSVSLCWGHDEPVPLAMWQILFGLPRCSSRQGWLGRMPVPDGR